MAFKNKNKTGKDKRHARIRKKIFGDSQKPRLAVFRSLKNMYVQVIDDVEQKTLLGITTASKEFKEKCGSSANIKAAQMLGEILAKKAVEKGIEQVKFDRGGFNYHGRVKAFAESARKNGLKF
ncbi:MAG: 50S ribosomal protein L18 [Candidatus Omnitrophota bacterium]